jgi:hypothetical protein
MKKKDNGRRERNEKIIKERRIYCLTCFFAYLVHLFVSVNKRMGVEVWAYSNLEQKVSYTQLVPEFQ